MRRILLTLATSALLLAPASVAHAQLSLAIRIGEPPPPRAYRVMPQPGPDYLWIEGYWYPQGRHYVWHDGYWTRPPYVGAYWVAPYHLGGQYYAGHWEGSRGVVVHDHRWDQSRDRDEHRYEDHR
jgi:YXWGXW repeat-containing protein